MAGAIIVVRRVYYDNLKPVSASQKNVTVTIPLGSSPSEIAQKLYQAGVIRSEWAFEWYVRTKELRDELLAGTYNVRPNQTVEEIVTVLTQGKVATDLLTILPGQRLDQIKSGFVQAGFDEAEVTKAFDSVAASGHVALVDKPEGANLEGYLYPESFQKTADTKVEDILTQSLDQMAARLTPDIRAGMVAQGLNVHQGVILASIVEQEVSKTEDKPKVAQVFLTRLTSGMKLESDPTATYGAVVAGQAASLRYDSLYNTYLYGGLPPGPISNVSESSLQAVAAPAQTDWLFFVAGDDGVTYFSRTLEEHQQLTKQHCTKLCGN